MGLLANPLRTRKPRLPLYRRLDPPTKERSPDDGYESSDADSERSLSSDSQYSWRHGPAPSRSLLPKRRPPPPPPPPPPPRRSSARAGFGRYPYRLPAKVTRYVVLGVVGTIVLMVLCLVRASQVDNWKLQNGKLDTPPPPPPIWEKFAFLERYYGGIRTLRPLGDSEPQYPRPASEPHDTAPPSEGDAAQGRVADSRSWDDYPARSNETGAQPCFLDAAGAVLPVPLRYYEGRPRGFPEHVAGSYEVLGLPEDVCFERFGRYGPYGFGYSVRAGGLGTGEHGEREGAEAVWGERRRINFGAVDWAGAQRRCFEANAGRFKELPPPTPPPGGFFVGGAEAGSKRDVAANSSGQTGAVTGKTARTAVVVRCWDDFVFRQDDMANLRALVAELSLASGGRYDVHLLVQVKDDAHHPIWADGEAYEKRIRDSIPREFRGLVTLWTETQMLAVYQGVYDLWTRGPELPVHGVYRGLSMAMQHFAHEHPEYDFYWQWEMDVRYTGHYLDLVTKLEGWARAQPRKGLWERSARFYFPSVHGSWGDFAQMSRIQSEMAAGRGAGGADDVWGRVPGVRDPTRGDKEKDRRGPVWGPVRPADAGDWFETDADPVPETAYEADRHQWGVGEEADLITLSPIFDPEGTTWKLRDDMTGFNRSLPLPPRRAAIITTSRLSRRLLMTMHRATAYKKQFAFPEMWPATVALHHGFKAVAAPHPVFVDRRWPLDFMAATLNGGRDGTAGGARTSVFGDREHNLRGLSWFYSSGFAPNLYRRWLGLRVNNDGGDEFERTADASKQGPGVGNMPGGEGRMCLPPMLLHPVKDVDLPREAPPPPEAADEEEGGGGEVPESDPSA